MDNGSPAAEQPRVLRLSLLRADVAAEEQISCDGVGGLTLLFSFNFEGGNKPFVNFLTMESHSTPRIPPALVEVDLLPLGLNRQIQKLPPSSSLASKLLRHFHLFGPVFVPILLHQEC